MHELRNQNISYVITNILVSSSVSGKQISCFVHVQGQKREQKHSTKNFVESHNHCPLVTMIQPSSPLIARLALFLFA